MSAPVSVAKGAALVIAMRWTHRLIGLVSTLILARLLVPDDFGVVAQASLVVGLLDVLTDMGVASALIQNANATQRHYDTAWTIRLAQFSLASVAILLLAPTAGEYFGDARVVPVLQVMSLGLIVAGCENIGVVNFQKEMRFGLDFRFMFTKRLSGFLITVTLAVLWESYWAMVAGAIGGRMVGVLVSYRMHPMRPRFSLAEFGSIFGFAQWMLVRNIGNYLNNNVHRLLVGGRGSTAQMGAYSLANDVAQMPGTEIISPLNRVLFPAFVRAKEDPEELNRLVLLALGVQALVAIPACVGLGAVAHEAVLVLLGEKWLSATAFIEILTLAYLVPSITSTPSYVLMSLGYVRLNAVVAWCQLTAFVSVAVLILPTAGALEIAQIRLATVLVTLVGLLFVLVRTLPLMRWRSLLGVLFRPIAGAVCLVLAVDYVAAFLPANPYVSLVAKVATGALAYVLSVVVLWLISGRPQGAESYLVSKLRSLRRARKKTS